MRTNKLIKKKSTKAERKFHEILKKLHIPFETKAKINGKEIDFLIGKIVIEIDGHKQNVEKNKMLISNGYSPIHLNNWEINSDLENWIKKICQEQDYSHH